VSSSLALAMMQSSPAICTERSELCVFPSVSRRRASTAYWQANCMGKMGISRGQHLCEYYTGRYLIHRPTAILWLPSSFSNLAATPGGGCSTWRRNPLRPSETWMGLQRVPHMPPPPKSKGGDRSRWWTDGPFLGIHTGLGGPCPLGCPGTWMFLYTTL
jgi:hypothetical protein